MDKARYSIETKRIPALLEIPPRLLAKAKAERAELLAMLGPEGAAKLAEAERRAEAQLLGLELETESQLPPA